MDLTQYIFMLLVLLALSAFFSLAEISLAAARRLKLEQLAEEGDERASRVLALQARSGQFFTSIQIGVNTVAILAGAFGESMLTPHLQAGLTLVYNGPVAESLTSVIAFALITTSFILFADLVPKRVAMNAPEQVALHIIKPMQLLITLLLPLVWLFNAICDRLLVWLGLPKQRSDDVTTDDIYAMVAAGAQAGLLTRHEHDAIENLFELESRLVTFAMTTRESIIYFTLQEAESAMREQIGMHAHSKFPVCDDVIDRVIGYVDSKDLLLRIINNQSLSLSGASWIKPVLTVPDFLTLSELLTQFRASREDFAVVVNEYTLVVGVVTLNDVMSTVMGDMVVATQQQIVKRDDNSWLIDGFTPVEDVMHALSITDFPDDASYETIAGFMMYRLRKVPKLTDCVSHAGYTFEVVDIDAHRIDQLLVTRTPIPAAVA